MFKTKDRSKQAFDRPAKTQNKAFFQSNSFQFVAGLAIFLISLYLAMAIVSFFFTGGADQSKIETGVYDGIHNWTGVWGARVSNALMNEGFGVSTLFLLVFLMFVGLRLMKARYMSLLKNFILCGSLTIWLSLALSFFLDPLIRHSAFYYIGGKHGFAVSDIISQRTGRPGAFMIIMLTFVIIMAFVTSNTVPFLQRQLQRRWSLNLKLPQFLKRKTSKPKDKTPDEPTTDEPHTVTPPIKTPAPVKTNVNDDDFKIKIAIGDDDADTDIPKPPKIEIPPSIKPAADDEDDAVARRLLEELGRYDPRADLAHYRFPTLDLLKTYEQKNTLENIRQEQENNKNRIISTLDNFGIRIKRIEATVGPTVTLYEIVIEDGIKINKVRGLEDDIAMSLSALGIRIIAPMPGKGTIGIEVPNSDPQIVSMQSTLASRKFQETKFELPIALGRTITNEVFMVDLTKMPHLLVAGATGQGKSVGLNAAITSLLYKKHPGELKFVLIDPKMVEFSLYSVIERHFLAKLPDAEKPIITDFTKVIYTLNSLCIEMDDRYKLLEKAGSRNVQEYNEKFVTRRLNPMKGHRFMPYIVVIIDEFGDLIMTAGKEIEQPIARIAQKARAVGMHMIIATQRPTTNIITGTIKANFPARIAFRVITAVDSRTILDSTGANQLIGRGDMLFFQGNDKTRIQCAFVDTPEVERIVKFIGNQQGYPEALMLPEYSGPDGQNDDGSAPVTLENLDPLFRDAAALIVTEQAGSTSRIQRKFSIGYNRAGRLMDQLELAGIVGPAQGSKPRDVLIIDQFALDQKMRDLGI